MTANHDPANLLHNLCGRLTDLCNHYWDRLDGDGDRQLMLESLLSEMEQLVNQVPAREAP